MENHVVYIEVKLAILVDATSQEDAEMQVLTSMTRDEVFEASDPFYEDERWALVNG